jgi:hypothetical protein
MEKAVGFWFLPEVRYSIKQIIPIDIEAQCFKINKIISDDKA